MRKRNLFLFAMFLGMTAEAEVWEWDAKNSFQGWDTVRNAKSEIKNGVFALSEVKADPGITISPVSIDPSKYNTLTYTYRAAGAQNTAGQLFYARPHGRFSDRQCWRLPRINADGKWHTVTVKADALANKASWFDGGIVTQLRFDITDSAASEIEIKELKFGFEDPRKAVKPAAGKKASVPVIMAAEWSKDNSFAGWQGFNCKAAVDGDFFALTDIKSDPQILIAPLALDSSKYNTLTYTYRAENSAPSRGQLYFALPNGKFSDSAKWSLPPLQSDGKWHTVTVKAPANWNTGGIITGIRFDITDKGGGKIEIKELKFGFNASVKSKQSVSKPFPKVPVTLDAPEWPEVKPKFTETEIKVVGEPYFQGKMIKSPQDLKSGGKYNSFLLRREFTLKAKPSTAWLQYTADDSATVYVNGIAISTANDWHYPRQDEVSPELKAGKNVLAFRYQNSRSAGGVLAELYIAYPDGSSEKINTDGKFLAGLREEPGWNKPGFSAKGWEKVIEQFGPPTPPWVYKMAYSDFSRPQTFISGKINPATADAGKKVNARFEFSGKIPESPAKFKLTLLKNNQDIWNEEIVLQKSNLKTLPDGRWAVDFDYELPHYLRSADLTMRLSSGSIFCKSGGLPDAKFTYRELKTAPGFENKITSRINAGKNGPIMMLNEKPFFPVWGKVNYKQRPDKTYRFGDAPLNVVTVGCNYDQNFYPSCGKFVSEALDRSAEQHRRDYGPDVLFMWDISLYPPLDWGEKNKEEMALDDHGEINKDGRTNHSFASQRALRDMKEILIKAIDYLEKSPYANRIVGYRVNGGHTIEWLGWDPKPGRILDFSPVTKKAFAEFAEKHYPELKDFTVPSLAERRQLDNGELLWDPKKHERVIAYHDFYSNAVADMLIDLCKAAKEKLNHRKVVGTYYGYTSTLHASGNSQMRAHYALKKVLDSKAVDFLMSPQAYGIRNIGDTCGDMKPFQSMRMNNIIPVIEDDTRTHNGPYLTFSNNFQTLTKDATIAVMRRNMGIAIARNLPIYYYALCAGTEYDFPEMTSDIATLRKLGEHCVKKDIPRAADIALVFSEETIKSMPMYHRNAATNGYFMQRYRKDGSVSKERVGSTVLTGESFSNNLTRYARSGAATDYLLAEDLADNPGNYKLYVFVNCFKYDAKFLAAVNELKKRDCTLFWVYAPGYTCENKNSVENMKILTGFDFVKASEPLMPAVKLADGRWMGTTTTRIKPMFSVKKNTSIKVLGVYEDGTAGYAEIRTGKARSIFCGAYQFDVPFLMELVRKSGAHIYSETSDPMEANSALFTLHARFPGRKTVRLPKKTNVLDVMNRKLIAKNVNTFTFEAPLHSSWIFYYGNDAEDLLKKLNK